VPDMQFTALVQPVTGGMRKLGLSQSKLLWATDNPGTWLSLAPPVDQEHPTREQPTGWLPAHLCSPHTCVSLHASLAFELSSLDPFRIKADS
jgi:hypothetical protein